MNLKPNTIYCGDCLFVLGHDIPPRSIDLIYLDPPFFTGKIQKGTVWNPEAMEVSFEDSKRFWSEKHYYGAPAWMKMIGDKRPDFAAYLYYMQQRLDLCKRVLKDTGLIYLHCDNRASHYLKMVMDTIFGDEHFRNEIVWCYAGGGIPKKDFPNKHDIVFRYSKTNSYFYRPEYRKYSEGTVKVGGGRHSLTSGGEKLDLNRGTPINDWWADFPKLTSYQEEWLGYPTQKPPKLLERIINTSSNEGDLVLDPFCGCGTTIAEAEHLKRKWIGIDKSYDACRVIQQQQFVKKFNFEPPIVPRTFSGVMQLNEREFEGWVNDFYDATKPMPDFGVDGITKEGIAIQSKAYAKPISYDLIDKFLNAAKYHDKVSKPVKELIMVSQSGFDEKARARVFKIKDDEGTLIDLQEPKIMLPLEE